jgi:hypothetical protein
MGRQAERGQGKAHGWVNWAREWPEESIAGEVLAAAGNSVSALVLGVFSWRKLLMTWPARHSEVVHPSSNLQWLIGAATTRRGVTGEEQTQAIERGETEVRCEGERRICFTLWSRPEGDKGGRRHGAGGTGKL